MNPLALTLAAALAAPGQAPATLPPSATAAPPAAAQPAAPVIPPAAPAAPGTSTAVPCPPPLATDWIGEAMGRGFVPERRPFQSDHAFDGFVNPVSNPVLAKDPRSNTWFRFVFVNNTFPGGHPVGGDAQVYGFQVNVAVTERLAIIADKDGVVHASPNTSPSVTGAANIAAGLKYTLVRDVENQFLFAAGAMIELPTGEAKVFQGNGSGIITPFITYGKEFAGCWHLLGTHGYSFGVNGDENSDFFYHSIHIDRGIGGWFYPLAELNWYQYTRGGMLQPPAVGEGDGLLNLGTRGMKGKQLVTTAFGAKVVFSQSLYAGVAYEFPLSDYKGILNNRLNFDLVVRY